MNDLELCHRIEPRVTSKRKQMLERREAVKEIVFSHKGISPKDIAKLIGVSSSTVCLDIKAIDSIGFIDCKVYAK
jgi:transposase